MGTFSIWHWLIVLAVVLVLFGGGGKISKLMGDFGKGLKSFKKNIKEEGEDGSDGASDEAPAKILETDKKPGAGEATSDSSKDRAASR